MKIAISGATGLVGSRFVELFGKKYDLVHLSSSRGADITDRDRIWEILSKEKPQLILHMAAKTNVDLCEEDKDKDIEQISGQRGIIDEEIDVESLKSEAWTGIQSAFAINVIGTKNLATWAKANQIKIIYISTDFVFDGEKGEPYTETDQPNPINWYGMTKLLGEKVLSENSLIARIAYPYGLRSSIKKDFIWTLIELIKTRNSVRLVSDQIITPTFIDDIARGLDFLIEQDARKIINLVGNDFLSPYKIGLLIADIFSLKKSKIGTISCTEFYLNRAQRPFKVRIKNDKLRDLGFKMTDFADSLKKIKQTV